ncbi:hypothetical protein DS2_06881 [Catenovulum agarivorans DS-2]|uniref:Fibronectin type-III domain-containing protein n=1 Tax=Catenovulum agarivorans DS-2 TaxID=1328313 RepID=W7QZG5_9ALTE|nr:Ig-like domain-containing protein [Catenovulum agarivorans]EWH10755.1 hypothetical protein DS2_06881 [Catenovulum agarivorans DS-2]
MKTPCFYHLVKSLPISFALVLAACGGDSAPNQSNDSSVEPPINNITVSQQSYSDFQLPKRFVSGQPVHYINDGNTARRALPTVDLADLTGDFTEINTSLWQSQLLNLEPNVQGGFFIRLKLSPEQNINLPSRLFFTFSGSDKNIILCQPCNQSSLVSANSNELDITLTGINPANFDLSQGSQVVEIWGQSAEDIDNQSIRLVASQSFTWQPANIDLTTIERSQASISLNWQNLGGDYSHYNVYWQQDDQPQEHQLAISENNFSLPATGGNYKIQVKGVDSHGESAQSEIILLGNQAPTFSPSKISLSEDSQSQFNILDNIADNEDHQVSFLTGTFSTAQNGSITLNQQGDVSYTPADNFFGLDSFSFELADEFNATTTATIEFEVVAVNDAPTATTDSFSVTSGQTSFQIPYSELLDNDFDIDGDTLTVESSSIANIENATIEPTSDGLTFNVSFDFIGQVRFSYQATDGTALSEPVSVAVNVGDIAQTLRAINDSYEINEDTSLDDNLTANDSINASLPFSLAVVSQPNHGSLILDEAGQFSYQPSADFNGTDTFTYQITQADTTAQAAVSITITAVNDTPRLQADSYSVNKGELLNILAPGVLGNDSDADGESLTASLLTPPAQGELTLNSDGSFSYQANEAFVGNLSFVYVATDTAGSSEQQSVSLEVKDINLPPEVSNGSFVTAEDQSINISLINLTRDPEGDPLVYNIATDALNGQTSIQSGILNYQPASNYFGSDTIVFSVSDGVNAPITGQIDLSVTAVNDPPIISQTNFSLDEDSNKTIVLADFVQDAEQDSITFEITAAPQFGQASLSEGTLNYTPNDDFSGLDSLTLTMSDGQGGNNQVTLQFAVAIENDPPTFNNQTLTTQEDITLTIDLETLVDDPDGDSLSFELLSGAENGQTNLSGNTLIFVPNPEFSGQDKVQLQVSDGLLTDSAEFTITVEAVNDAPISQNAAANVNSGTSILIDLSNYATDAENDTLTFSIQTSPTQGSANIEGSSLLYTPNSTFEGTDSLAFVANDGELNSAPATISFTVSSTQQEFSPHLVSHIQTDEKMYDIAVNQTTAYIAQESGIAIYDISDKNAANLVETITTSSRPYKILFNSGTLYLVLDGGNLETWDVSSSSTPTNLASLHLGGKINDIAIVGPYLIVANEQDGVDFVYSDQGQTLTKALQFHHHEKITAVATNGDYVALATEQNLYVLNTDDIESPDLSQAAQYSIAGIRNMHLSSQNLLHVACNFCGYKVFKIEQDSTSDSVGVASTINLVHDNNRFFPTDIAISQGFALFNDSLFTNALPIVNLADEQAPNFSQLIDLSESSLEKSNAIAIDNQYVYAVSNNRFYIGKYRALESAPSDASSRFSLDYFAFLNPQVTEDTYFEIQANYQMSDNLNELVQSVSFFIDDVLIGTDTTWPYTYRARAKSDNFAVKVRFTFVDDVAFDVTQTLSPLPDSDEDGLSDLIEISRYNSNKDLVDSDSDGLTDLFEAIIFTNLDQADSDSDGFNDKAEFDNNESPINSDRTIASIEEQSPANNATDVCEYEPVTIKFNETISVKSVNTSSFYLTNGENVVAANVSFLLQNTGIKLTPTSNLQSNSTYEVFVPAISDLAGNLTAAFSYSFTTGACAESARPSVDSVLPNNNSTDIATNTQVIVKIDEPVKASSVNSDTFRLTDLKTNQVISGTLSLMGNNDTIVFVPDEPLKSGRQHYLSLTTGLTDLFDNALFAHTARFTTGYQADTVAPELTTFSIRENDSSVPINAVVAAKFSEAIDPLNLAGVNFSNQTNSQAVNFSLTLADDNTRLLIQPEQALEADNIYQINISGIKDTSGNVIAQTQTLNFTTTDTTFTDSLDVAAWSFKSSQTQMPKMPVLTVAHNHAVDPTSINHDSIYLWDNSAGRRVATDNNWSSDHTRVSLIPLQALKENRRYTLYVSYNQRLKDITNTNAVALRTRSFTTGFSSDTNAPSMVDSGITEQSIVVDKPIIIGFNEAINPYCQNAQIQLFDSQGDLVEHSINISSDLTSIAISPASSLTGESQYSLSISDLCDMAGNQLPNQQLALTTAANTVTDNSAPNLSAMVPAHRAAEIELDTQIVLTYDEILSPLSKIKVTHSGIEVNGATTISGNTVTFVPDEPLRGDTRYVVSTSYTIMDIFGNNAYSATRYFDTISQTDDSKPQIVATSPINGQTEVNPVQAIEVKLNEALTSNSISASNIGLFHQGEKLSATITRSADNKSIFISSALPEHSLISLVLTNELTDLGGNALDPFVMSFTTGSNTNETTRPTVLNMNPSSTAYSLTNIDTLYLYMSESINESSLTDNLFVTQDGVLLPIQIEMLANDRIIKLTNSNDFASGSLVEVRLTTGVTDHNGNYLYAYNTSIYIGDGIDTNAVSPYPVAYSPNSFSQIDILNPVLRIKFSEAMAQSSINSNNFVLTNTSENNIVPVDVSLASNQTIVSVKPQIQLNAGDSYTLTIEKSIEDTDGDQLPFNRYIYFTVTEDASLDNRAPQMVNISPLPSTQAVPLQTQFSVAFDEAVDLLSFDYSDTTFNSLQISTDNKVITLKLAHPLTENTSHSLTLPQISDFAGNLVTDVSTNFTTGSELDFTSPHIISQTEIVEPMSRNLKLYWRFNETIDFTSVDSSRVYLFDTVTSEHVPVSLYLSHSGTQLNMQPESQLAAGRKYTYIVYGVRDLTGRSVSYRNHSFNTGFDSDTAAPELVNASMLDNASDIPINHSPNFQFNEAINLNENMVVQLEQNGVMLDVQTTLSFGQTLLTVTPTQLFEPNSQYRIEISGITDTAGNGLSQTIVRNFTTGAQADLVAPSFETWSLAQSGQTNVPRNPEIILEFGETIDRATVASDTIYLYNNGHAVRVPIDFSYGDNLNSIKLKPTEPLDANTSYSLYISTWPYVKDLGGNRAAYRAYGFTTGELVDETSPSIVTTSFANQTSDIPVNAQLGITFDERISRACINECLKLVDSQGNTVEMSGDIHNDFMGATLTFGSGLAPLETYQLIADNMLDYAGNPYSGTIIEFSTGSVAIEDTEAPNLVSITPNHNATEVEVTTEQIQLTFDENISQLSSVTILADGYEVAGEQSVSGSTLTFTFAENLRANTRYIVELYRQIPDFAGNTRNIGTRQFETSTSGQDTTAPSIVSVTPNHGSSDIAVNSEIWLEFSEPMNASTLNTSHISLFENGQRKTTSVSRSADGKRVKLTTGTFSAGSTISVVVNNSVTDLANNAITPYVASFTTGIDTVESARPSVAHQYPAANSQINFVPQNIQLYLTESIDASTVPSQIQIARNGETNTANVSVSAENIITITPTEAWQLGDRIDYSIPNQIRDLAGNYLYNYDATLTINNPEDSQLRVVGYFPHASSTNLADNVQLSVQFNQAIDEDDVSDDFFVLLDTSTDSIVATDLTLHSSGNLVFITPETKLAADTTYRLTVSNGIRSENGVQQLNSANDSYYTTAEQAFSDNIAPTIELFSPADGSNNIGLNPEFSVKLDESVNPLLFATTAWADKKVMFDDSNKLITYQKHQPLTPNTSVTETLSNIQDSAGNLAAAHQTTFATAANHDLSQPQLLSTNVTSGQEDVATNAVIELVYSEAINPAQLAVESQYLYNTATQQYSDISVSYLDENSRISITPTQALDAGTAYNLIVGRAKDTSGNRAANINYSFTTGFSDDNSGPFVANTSIANGQTDIAINSIFRVEFNESIGFISPDEIKLEDSTGTAVDHAIEYNNQRKLLIIKPQNLLQSNSAYRLVVQRITDISNNQTLNPVDVSFTTKNTMDITIPTVASYNFTNGQTTDSNFVPQIIFSETVDPTSVNSATVYLTDNNGNKVSGNLSLAADKQTLTFQPDTQLQTDIRYYLYISRSPYIFDPSGNRMNSTSRNFIVSESDTDSI